MSSPSPEFQARQLILPRPLYTPSPQLTSLLYDSHSKSLAFRHSDSSHSLYPSVDFLSISSFPSPQTLIPSPTSSATFLRLQTTPNSGTTVFLASSPIFRPSACALFRFYVLRGDVFARVRVLSNHKDLIFDQTKGGIVFNVNHGISMKLSGGINVFSLYSVSNSKIWIFSVRLVRDHEGGESLKLMKCAVIDCCFPIFEVRVLFGYLIMGEENGVRVFPLRQLIKGKHRKEKRKGKLLNVQNGLSIVADAAKVHNGGLSNGADSTKVSNGCKVLATDGNLNFVAVKGEKSEKNTEVVKLRSVKLRQDCRDMGAVFVSFEDTNFNNSISAKFPGKSVKAISIQALSANKFVIVDSVGELHLLCLSNSRQGSDSTCTMEKIAQSMKIIKMAIFHDVSAVTQTIWISDGCNTIHLLVVPDMNTSFGDSGEKGSAEKKKENSVTQVRVTQAILTSERIQDIMPMSASAILVLGHGSMFAYGIS